MIEKEKY